MYCRHALCGCLLNIRKCLLEVVGASRACSDEIESFTHKVKCGEDLVL